MTDQLQTNSIAAAELIERHKRDDPAFRAEWERTAFARDVAIAVLRYRLEHALDADQLAARLGVDAETVADLEDGEADPGIHILRLLSERLGLRFVLEIHPGTPSGVEVIHSVA